VTRIQHGAFNGIIVEGNDSFDIVSSDLRLRLKESIREFEKLSYPYICRKLFDVDYSDNAFIQDTLKPIMRNSLHLDHADRKSGADDCVHHFLCAEFDESNLPWDENQRD
jgi:hypothetical protein